MKSYRGLLTFLSCAAILMAIGCVSALKSAKPQDETAVKDADKTTAQEPKTDQAVKKQTAEELKKLLAFETTKIMHGEAEAVKARTASDSLFGGDASNIEGVPTFEMSSSVIKAGINVVDLMTQSGLAASKSEARRLITGGGAYVNEEKITAMDKTIGSSDIKDGMIMLRSGKKNYLKIIVK